MIHPSYTELIEAINENSEDDDTTMSLNSRYSLVLATSKRARQLIAGSKPLVEGAAGKKPLSIAIDELYKGKVKILAPEENEEEEQAVPSAEAQAAVETSEEAAQTEEAAVEETTEASSSEVAATDSDATWNRYPVGQCTWGVKEVAPWASNWWGNGGDWAGSAASQGYAVGSTPVTGSIVCWTDGGYGHVGYVTEVGQDGQIQILESNYNNQQQINNYRGWFDPQNSTTPGSVSYIYPGA